MSTTKVCKDYFPVQLCTTKLAHNTFQYYFVLQSLHKALPSTTLYYTACTDEAADFFVRPVPPGENISAELQTKMTDLQETILYYLFPQVDWGCVCGWLLLAPQGRRSRSYGHLHTGHIGGSGGSTELEEDPPGRSEHLAWVCHPPKHPPGSNDCNQAHACIGRLGTHSEHSNDCQIHWTSPRLPSMGHSGMPLDKKPHATILGLEDGGYFLRQTTKKVRLLALLMKELFTTPYRQLAQVPMVGMQRC